MTELTTDDNTDIMIRVMSDTYLHLQAAHGFKYTGTTVC